MRSELKLIAIAAVISFSIPGTHGANILGVFPSSSKSHLIIHMSIVKALVERGHNVTIVTNLPVEYMSQNLHHIYIPSSNRRKQKVASTKSKMMQAKSKFEMVLSTMDIVFAIGPTQFDVLKHKTFRDFMDNPDNKFDLVIIGYFFSDFLFGLGAHFNCPMVLSWTSRTNVFVGRHIGNPIEVSYVASTPMMGAPDALTFAGRLTNFISATGMSMLLAVFRMQMLGFYKELFPSPRYPSIDEAGKSVSLVLCNSHFTEGNIRPNVPAMIEIGGIHIKEKPDPLPKDIQGIFDGAAEHGVIYVSFGSNLGLNDISTETTQILFNVLSSLQQTVVWKWNSDELPGNSSNIHYRHWLPQDDLLPHPNLRVFVTHAGKGSVSESQYHGVPMVAIPIFADQPSNADQLERDGFGRQINIYTMTESILKGNILEVLQNSSYREKAKKFSELYRDRPMTANETAVYWIEYVIRHKGAYHMQSPLVHLNNLQYLCIDVLAFLFVVMCVVYKLVKIILKYLVSQIFGKRTGKYKMN